MIIGRDLMLELGLSSDFKHQFLQWDGTTGPMKEPSGILGKSDLTQREMSEVLMQTVEPASSRKATKILVKILDSTYAKAYLKQVADNATRPNAEKRTQLLRLPNILRTCLMVIYQTGTQSPLTWI